MADDNTPNPESDEPLPPYQPIPERTSTDSSAPSYHSELPPYPSQPPHTTQQAREETRNEPRPLPTSLSSIPRSERYAIRPFRWDLLGRTPYDATYRGSIPPDERRHHEMIARQRTEQNPTAGPSTPRQSGPSQTTSPPLSTPGLGSRNPRTYRSDDFDFDQLRPFYPTGTAYPHRGYPREDPDIVGEMEARRNQEERKRREREAKHQEFLARRDEYLEDMDKSFAHYREQDPRFGGRIFYKPPVKEDKKSFLQRRNKEIKALAEEVKALGEKIMALGKGKKQEDDQK